LPKLHTAFIFSAEKVTQIFALLLYLSKKCPNCPMGEKSSYLVALELLHFFETEFKCQLPTPVAPSIFRWTLI
jgi:hypothetical protein